jgi:Glu-tRNA(Gln) amidotransferase subunit E-like FAD-binding protein
MQHEKIDSEAIFAELEKSIQNRQLAEQMLWSPYLSLFAKIVKKSGVDGSIVAPILLEKTKQIRRMGVDVESINDETMIHIFTKYGKGEITKAAIEEILKQVPKTDSEVQRIIKEKKLERISGQELRKIVDKLRKEKKREDVVREVMSNYRLNVDGEELNRLLK